MIQKKTQQHYLIDRWHLTHRQIPLIHFSAPNWWIACLMLMWPCFSVGTEGTVDFEPIQIIHKLDYAEIKLTGLKDKCPAYGGVLQPPVEVQAPLQRYSISAYCTAQDTPNAILRVPLKQKGNYQLHWPDDWGLAATTITQTSTPNWGHITVDKHYPYRFAHSNGNTYHPLGTTAYGFIGLTNLSNIQRSIETWQQHGINRVRFLLFGDLIDGEYDAQFSDEWYGKIQPFRHNNSILPWADDYEGYTEAIWQRMEQVLELMHQHHIVASIILTIDRGHKIFPPANSETERQYYQYVASRFGSLPNVMFDLGNEHNEYRPVPAWARTTADVMQKANGSGLVLSAHAYAQFLYQNPIEDKWVGWQNIQHKGTPAELYRWVIGHRLAFSKPVINEEYGYETAATQGLDADTIRRKAWAIVMAGGYPTYGANKCGDFADGNITPGCSDYLTRGWSRVLADFLQLFDLTQFEPYYPHAHTDQFTLVNDETVITFGWRDGLSTPEGAIRQLTLPVACRAAMDTTTGVWSALPEFTNVTGDTLSRRTRSQPSTAASSSTLTESVLISSIHNCENVVQ